MSAKSRSFELPRALLETLQTSLPIIKTIVQELVESSGEIFE